MNIALVIWGGLSKKQIILIDKLIADIKFVCFVRNERAEGWYFVFSKKNKFLKLSNYRASMTSKAETG